MDPYNAAEVPRSAQPPALPPANPYAAPGARIADIRYDDTLEKASRGARLAAVLLDGFIVAVPVMLVAILLPMFAAGSGGKMSAIVAGAVGLVFGLGFIAFVAFQLVLIYRHGQTLGKKLVGIRIVRTDGSRAGLRRIFLLRALVPGIIGAIPLIGPLFSLVDPLFIFGEERRCVHDLIADTIVVNA